MKNLVIIGFKGCGKTAVGRELAKKLGKKFFDIDKVLEKIYEEENGRFISYREIHARHGKDFFREIEGRAVKKVSQEKDCVIALGGGTPIFNNNGKLLKKNSILLYLEDSPEALFQRIVERGVPAFLDPNNLEGSMQRVLEERAPVYEKLCDYKIDIIGISIEEIVEKIMSYKGISFLFL